MKKIISLITSFAMIMTMFIGISPVKAEEGGTLNGHVAMDTIEFGSYPQTEIVAEASQSGVYGQSYEVEGDYEVNASLYANLEDEDGWTENDKIISGIKYRRITNTDATCAHTDRSWGEIYWWSKNITYHYFRYEPIKWRIRYINGNKAFIYSDICLDDQRYNDTSSYTTWETCTLRSWINDEFLNRAFSPDEQKAILQTTIKNEGNEYYEIDSSNDTTDKVFILSASDVKDYYAGAKSSTYAKAMGSYAAALDDNRRGNCKWWLRTPGWAENYAMYVLAYGGPYEYGDIVSTNMSVRPALYINLNSTAQYKINYLDDTVSASDVVLSDSSFVFDGDYQTPGITINGLTNGIDFNVEYSNNINAGNATVTITGIGNYSGTIKKTFNILPADISKESIILEQKDFIYSGNEVKPSVSVRGIDESNYSVKYSNNINAGTGAATITGIGNYTGTIKKTFNILPVDISKKSIMLEQQAFTYLGSEIKPSVSVQEIDECNYSVKYSNNINAGTATVTITGIGNYSGTISAQFEIIPIDLSDKTANLSKTSYTYSGKANKPTVTIDGLKKGTDYTVSYKNNTKCGKATVTIKGVGNYTGSITKTFTIKPAKAKISKVTAGSKSITVKINSQKASGVTGYQIYYKKAGASAKTVTTTSTSKKLTKLTKGKKYTIKVRAYKTIDGKKVYGAYSASKTVKVK